MVSIFSLSINGECVSYVRSPRIKLFGGNTGVEICNKTVNIAQTMTLSGLPRGRKVARVGKNCNNFKNFKIKNEKIVDTFSFLNIVLAIYGSVTSCFYIILSLIFMGQEEYFSKW